MPRCASFGVVPLTSCAAEPRCIPDATTTLKLGHPPPYRIPHVPRTRRAIDCEMTRYNRSLQGLPAATGIDPRPHSRKSTPTNASHNKFLIRYRSLMRVGRPATYQSLSLRDPPYIVASRQRIFVSACKHRQALRGYSVHQRQPLREDGVSPAVRSWIKSPNHTSFLNRAGRLRTTAVLRWPPVSGQASGSLNPQGACLKLQLVPEPSHSFEC